MRGRTPFVPVPLRRGAPRGGAALTRIKREREKGHISLPNRALIHVLTLLKEGLTCPKNRASIPYTRLLERT